MQDLLLKLWIFFGFRIWGIGLVLGILFFGTTGLLPFLPEKAVGVVVGSLGVIWIANSLYKLFKADNPSIDSN